MLSWLSMLSFYFLFVCFFLTSYFLLLTSALLQVVFLDVLEVLVGSDLQLVGGGLVANDDAMLVGLQGRDGPCLTNWSLDSSLQSTSLMVTIAENHHLAGSHHGAYTNGQGQLGNLIDIVVEETRVGNDGI